jgi:tetratricopeptide (TPR) repeat protein
MMSIRFALALLALAYPLALALPLEASAAEPAPPAASSEPIDHEQLRIDRKARASRYPVDSRVSRYLKAAAEKSDEESAEEAFALLDRLDLNRRNPYERALIHRLRGYIAYSSGDYAITIQSFENVIGEEVMSPDVDNGIRFNIAQLYAAQQKWADVIPAMERWLRYAPVPKPLAYYLIGLSHFQLGQLDLAIENTETAIDLSPKPVESWLQLLAALYVQQGDLANVTPVLEELVMRFPKKQYWNQLSLIYGARDDYRHSLAVQQVAYLQGFLTEDKELRRLARSYLYHELPLPAADVLQRGIERGEIEADASSYEMLANSWIASREYDRSLSPLQTAAELAEDGKLFVRLGQVHLQREEWEKAATRLEQALEKGGLSEPGSAKLLLGIAYYENKRVTRARATFQRARKHDESRDEADRWIVHIQNEARDGSSQNGEG